MADKAVLKIRLFGDPCLRKRSKALKRAGPSERMLIASMIETMHQTRGIGLAAPQVGINEQILVVDIGEGPLAIINPSILKKSGSDIMEEGCLSIPGVQIKIKRAKKILVRYLDENNNLTERECHDLLARVISHEIDHLQGKLIIDYAGWHQKLKLKEQLRKIRRLSKQNYSPSP